MFSLAEQFLLGLSAVVHTVLLLVVLERSNRPLTAIWLKWSLAGATVWHLSSFFHVLLRQVSGPTSAWLDVVCMVAMVCGLLLLNCGVLHAALRIQHTGAVTNPPVDRRYLAVYFPLLFVLAVGAGVVASDSRDFLIATKTWQVPYLAWLTAANLTAAWLFYRHRFVFEHETASRFFVRFALSLVALTIVTIVYVLLGVTSPWEPVLRLLTSVSPLLPTLIFAWYVFRRRLLPMVFERTLAYGAILLGILYLHRLTISPLMQDFGEQLRFDFVLVEGLLLVSLVLAYHPLRNRVREGLRYLVDSRVEVHRDATRQLSVDLTRRSSADPTRIIDWFAAELRRSLQVDFVCVQVTGPCNHTSCCTAADFEEPEILQLSKAMQLLSVSDRWLDRTRCHKSSQLQLMRNHQLMAVFPLQYESVDGCVLVGMPQTADRLADEQLNATLMLIDQFAAVLETRHLDQVRQSAERHALQQEKLSVLGLLSGSLAHELKNPLSSIRTIATLLKEDLPPDSEAHQEVDLILSEIDRLTETTGRLLDFARPVQQVGGRADPDRVVNRLLKILGHLARQHDVTLQHQPAAADCSVAVSEAELNDVLFNLIRNAIEAVRQQERRDVTIRCQPNAEDSTVTIEVIDSGPGIPERLQSQIFQPFVTDKSDGTGLGLYLVAQRLRDVDGSIQCHSVPGRTNFEITLPLAKPKA